MLAKVGMRWQLRRQGEGKEDAWLTHQDIIFHLQTYLCLHIICTVIKRSSSKKRTCLWNDVLVDTYNDNDE